ncbi:helix-turn-helix transcriptional regulator [Paenibacillus flagellatus]|uniref:Transcriptional regulator n=1 Tax=Paenibacillus flagellatus TaxID=2211139 RepID=A0A2V5KC78_9BACL|nr:WYL domain-containing protein [Paenibacillus flagellatus]PYI55764.1 transcriptional regulator [Paenibacillus flagellatus]
MSNMHRIQWFDQQVREGRYPNSSRLAERFEISKRQAQRDIEYMESSLRAPLAYVPRKRGYAYEDKAYVLPLLYMTDEEKKILKYLAVRYKQYSYDNAASVNRIAHLLEKFTDEGSGNDGASVRLPVFGAEPRTVEAIQLLSGAIREHRVVHVHYREGERESRLDLRPLQLESRYEADFLTALDERSGERMTLRLDAVGRVAMTDRRFEPVDGEAGHSGEEPGRPPVRKPFTARVELARPPTGRSWSGYPIRLEGASVYEVQFYDIDSFVQHLLVAEWEKLLSPK